MSELVSSLFLPFSPVGKYMDKMHASHRMGIENQTFMKVAAIGTWLGDFITAWMVTDMMLQVNKCRITQRARTCITLTIGLLTEN